MKKVLTVSVRLATLIFFGCGSEKTAEQPASETEKAIAKVIKEKKDFTC